jgi:hypothetical protein
MSKFSLFQLVDYDPMGRRSLLKALEVAHDTGDQELVERAQRDFMLGGQYAHVADVEAVSLDQVYKLTNTIDSPWYENPEVTIKGQKPGYRSTDVGDIIVHNDTAYCCAPFGWQQLPPAIEQWLSNKIKPVIAHRSTDNSLTFEGGQGFDFKLLIIAPGEPYGSNPDVLNKDREAIVEFYDTRYAHCEHGQLVSRYYASTLLEDSPEKSSRGLNMQGGVGAWQIDGDHFSFVASWLSNKLGITQERVANAEARLACYDFGGELRPVMFGSAWTGSAPETIQRKFMVCRDDQEIYQFPRITIDVAFAAGSSEVQSVSVLDSKGEQLVLVERDQEFEFGGPSV